MNVLCAASAMTVRTVRTPAVSSSIPDVRRPVSARNGDRAVGPAEPADDRRPDPERHEQRVEDHARDHAGDQEVEPDPAQDGSEPRVVDRPRSTSGRRRRRAASTGSRAGSCHQTTQDDTDAPGRLRPRPGVVVWRPPGRSEERRGFRPRDRTGLRLPSAGRRHDGPMADPRAGQPAQPPDLVDVAAPGDGLLHRRPRPRGSSTSRSPSAPAATAARRSTRRSTRPTSWPPRRRSATTAREQGYDGPLFIGRDTHGLSEPAWATALEVLVANDVTVLVDCARRATRRRRRSRTRSSAPTRGSATGPGWPTASWSRRRTTRRPTAASSTTRRTAAPPTPTRPR